MEFRIFRRKSLLPLLFYCAVIFIWLFVFSNNAAAVDVDLSKEIIPDSDTIFLLHLNDGFADAAGNGNNGTCASYYCPEKTLGKINEGAYYFNGSKYININDNEFNLTPAGDFSVIAWVKYGSLPADRAHIIFSGKKRDDSSFRYGISVTSDGEAEFEVRDYFFQKNKLTTSNLSINDEKWHQLAFVYDFENTGKMYIYADGLLVGEESARYKALGAHNSLVQIGRQRSSSGIKTCGNTPCLYKGALDEIAMWGRALTSAEVLGIYNKQTDADPPARSNKSPSGELDSKITKAAISLDTDENATCRYSMAPDIPYDSMADEFEKTGKTDHSTIISGLSAGSKYNFYVKCGDQAGNVNSDDYTISFSVASYQTPVEKLVRKQGEIKVYLLSDNKLRHIISPQVFRQRGYNWADVVEITEDEFNAHAIADPMTLQLYKTEDSDKIWEIVIHNGKEQKHWIPSPKVFSDLGYKWSDVRIINKDFLESYARITLLKSSSEPEVYFLNPEGLIQHIASPESFVSLNLKWEDVYTVTSQEIKSYKKGQVLS